MPLDGHDPSEYPGPDGGVLGDLSLNDIVEIRVRVNEKLEGGQIPTTLMLLNFTGDIFEVTLFSSNELQIFAGDALGRRSAPWVKYVATQQE
jgi:hypothetical protein